MRRALLTARSAPPVTVGTRDGAADGNRTQRMIWSEGALGSAAGAGLLNTARLVVPIGTAFDYVIFTINPSTRIVTDATAILTQDLVAGVNTIPLPAPLAVNLGDGIGIWSNGTGTANRINLNTTTAGSGHLTQEITSGTIAQPILGRDYSALSPGQTTAYSPLLWATT